MTEKEGKLTSRSGGEGAGGRWFDECQKHLWEYCII